MGGAVVVGAVSGIAGRVVPDLAILGVGDLGDGDGQRPAEPADVGGSR